MKYLTRNMGFLYKTYFAMLQTATSFNATECDTSKYGFLMSTIFQIRETQTLHWKINFGSWRIFRITYFWEPRFCDISNYGTF